jgi:hypothetical protein
MAISAIPKPQQILQTASHSKLALDSTGFPEQKKSQPQRNCLSP